MKKALRVVFFLIPFLLALAPGIDAPDFSMENQDGKILKLSDFKGKYLLLYFYPKDDTPGCTKEACAIRDDFSEFAKVNAVVLGVSRQDKKSHQAFRSKHQLPFDLLVDSKGELAKNYGVGNIPVLGVTKRQSILIGPDAKILRFYESVEPTKHAKQVLNDIKDFSANKK